MRKIIICFLVYFSVLCLAQEDIHISGQDPLVEEGLRSYCFEILAYSRKEMPNYWKLWRKQEELEKKATNPQSKAFLKWLRTWTPRDFDVLTLADFKLMNCPHLLAQGEYLTQQTMEKDLSLLFYDPFYAPYLRETGRYEEALKRLRDGTLRELYDEIRNHFDEVRDQLYREVEEYDPDLVITFYYFPDTKRVYYTFEVKTYSDLAVWQKDIEEREALNRISYLRDKLSPEEFERLRQKTVINLWVSGFGLRVFSLMESNARLYARRGEMDKAIYYWETLLSQEDRIIWWGYGGGSSSIEASPLQRDKEWRDIYLKQLRNRGEVDKLHPFLYINCRPFNPKKGFTKGGKPFVSADSFLKALNIPFEWTREGKLLTIKKEGGTMKIANINDKWWIYKDGERKEVEGYIKDKELYLPLEELCELLNLRLEWDENTFIGKVFTK
jgi:hypothetical protein